MASRIHTNLVGRHINVCEPRPGMRLMMGLHKYRGQRAEIVTVSLTSEDCVQLDVLFSDGGVCQVFTNFADGHFTIEPADG